MILALETATRVCSVAFCNEEGALFEKRLEKRGSHSEKLFLFIEELQDEHDFNIKDLEAVLVSQGPGSYTGLRISASAVKGLLFQSEVPLYGINTLASFARQGMQKKPSVQTIHSIIDARRVHVYHQQFTTDGDRLSAEDEVEVIPIKALEAMVREGDMIIGTGLDRVGDEILKNAVTLGTEAITAKSLISLYKGGFENFISLTDPESFDPKYYTSNQVR